VLEGLIPVCVGCCGLYSLFSWVSNNVAFNDACCLTDFPRPLKPVHEVPCLVFAFMLSPLLNWNRAQYPGPRAKGVSIGVVLCMPHATKAILTG
jgi:hypothetical protein